MTLRDELEGASGALGRFREQLDSASEALEEMADSASENGGGGGGRALSAAGRGAGSGTPSKAAGGGLLRKLGKSGYTAALSFGEDVFEAFGEAATPALSAYQSVGAEGATGAGLLSLAQQFRKSGSAGAFLSELTGISSAIDIYGRAGKTAGNTLEDLARAGIEIPDEVRQRFIDTTVEKETRAQNEREKVEGEIGKRFGQQAEKGDFGSIAQLLAEILALLRNLAPAGHR